MAHESKTYVLTLMLFLLLWACGSNSQGTRGYKLVLLVDPNETSRAEAQVLIASLPGVTVRAFATGGEAIAAMAGDRIDAVVTDLHMEPVDGFTVCRAATARHIPCIVITAGEANQRAISESGAGWWLLKQDVKSLPDVLKDVL